MNFKGPQDSNSFFSKKTQFGNPFMILMLKCVNKFSLTYPSHQSCAADLKIVYFSRALFAFMSLSAGDNYSHGILKCSVGTFLIVGPFCPPTRNSSTSPYWQRLECWQHVLSGKQTSKRVNRLAST